MIKYEHEESKISPALVPAPVVSVVPYPLKPPNDNEDNVEEDGEQFEDAKEGLDNPEVGGKDKDYLKDIARN